MPTLIERARLGLADALLGNEKRKLQTAVNTLVEGYFTGPWQLPPQELARQLREQDPWLITTMLDQLDWETIGGLGYSTDTDAERERAERESVRLYKGPMGQFFIWLWTCWGLGDKVTVTLNDEGAAEIWEEFWTADRNAALLGEDVIQELSNWLLVRGNQCFVFFISEVDGESTIRRIPPSEITEVITDPDDNMAPWFYKREWTQSSSSVTGKQKTIYYPDWQAFFSEDDLEGKWERLVDLKIVAGDADRADRMNSNGEEPLGVGRTGTVATMMHVAHNRKDDESLWGWPLLTAAMYHISAHNRFAGDRLTIAAAKAMFVRRKKVQGGSRALSSIADTIRTTLSATNYTERNPAAAAGSVELDNAMVDTEDLPMTTGASDAKADNEMFAWMAGLGAAIFTTSMGLDTSRWATALQMDKAQSMLFARYGTFWATQWRKMVKVVLLAKERYGGASFEDKSAEVSTDTFSLSDFPDVADAIGKLVRDALTPLVDGGTIPTDAGREVARALWQISLQALGVDDADDLTDEDLWEPDEEEEEQTPAQLLPYTQPAGAPQQPGQQPPPEQEEQPEVVERIAATILSNARDGVVDWEAVAEWALAEKMEGKDGMDQR